MHFQTHHITETVAMVIQGDKNRDVASRRHRSIIGEDCDPAGLTWSWEHTLSWGSGEAVGRWRLVQPRLSKQEIETRTAHDDVPLVPLIPLVPLEQLVNR